MDYKLELVVVPVADQDRARAFYVDQAGFDLLVDHQVNEHFRVLQVTPPGSACSIVLMHNPEAAGTVQGLHLVVADILAAQEDLGGRGVPLGGLHHYGETGQQPGPHPERQSYASFLPFSDPDGNGWLVQERAGG